MSVIATHNRYNQYIQSTARVWIANFVVWHLCCQIVKAYKKNLENCSGLSFVAFNHFRCLHNLLNYSELIPKRLKSSRLIWLRDKPNEHVSMWYFRFVYFTLDAEVRDELGSAEQMEIACAIRYMFVSSREFVDHSYTSIYRPSLTHRPTISVACPTSPINRSHIEITRQIGFVTIA